MAKYRGTKAGQRAIMYLLTPAIKIWEQKKGDEDFNESLRYLCYYVTDLDMGRSWRSQPSEKLSKVTAPDGVMYEMTTYPVEEKLRESVGVIIERLFGVDYKDVPRFGIPLLPGATAPLSDPNAAPPFVAGAQGPKPFSEQFKFTFQGLPIHQQFQPPQIQTPQIPRGFDERGPPVRSFPVNPNSPFSELVPVETRDGLARAFGVTLKGMLDSWEAIEKDFNLPEIPYYW
jgi:hypothetical protein